LRRKEIPAPKLPAGVIGSLEWHKNNRDLGLSMESARATYDDGILRVELPVAQPGQARTVPISTTSPAEGDSDL